MSTAGWILVACVVATVVLAFGAGIAWARRNQPSAPPVGQPTLLDHWCAALEPEGIVVANRVFQRYLSRKASADALRGDIDG
jgi:hypothetical protein